jgi:hypothetical protein
MEFFLQKSIEFVYRKLESKLVEKEEYMSARENQDKN